MTDKVQASHILFKHTESRRPADWKGNPVTRSKDEAIKLATELREKLVDGSADFAAEAKKVSDCSSARQGGDLGPFARGVMQKPFEDAAFALEVGGLSDIVSTDSGIHLIKRVA